MYYLLAQVYLYGFLKKILFVRLLWEKKLLITKLFEKLMLNQEFVRNEPNVI